MIHHAGTALHEPADRRTRTKTSIVTELCAGGQLAPGAMPNALALASNLSRTIRRDAWARGLGAMVTDPAPSLLRRRPPAPQN